MFCTIWTYIPSSIIAALLSRCFKTQLSSTDKFASRNNQLFLCRTDLCLFYLKHSFRLKVCICFLPAVEALNFSELMDFDINGWFGGWVRVCILCSGRLIAALQLRPLWIIIFREHCDVRGEKLLKAQTCA